MIKRIKTRDSVYILKEPGDVYTIVFTATRRIKRFKVDNLVKDVISAINGEKNLEILLSKLETRYPRELIFSCIDSLENQGIVNTYEEECHNNRYKRQITFIEELTNSNDETIALQKRLEDSKIAVFGVGGIGTWIINGLHQIGIGEIRIIDPDVVDETNLNRQLFFATDDIYSYKVDVIKRKIPDANIRTYKKTVSSSEDLDEIVRGCNFLVNCADSPSIAETSRIINKYATKYRIPYSVSGGYNMHLGMLGPIIIPGESACFDCFLEYQREQDPLKDFEKIKDVKQTGSIGPISGIIANLHVFEIFKYLIGKGHFNINKFAEIDFMDLSLEWRHYSKRKDCITCNT